MHNLFLQIKFILAGLRLDQTPPACAACTLKQVLAGHLQKSQYKPHTARPDELTRNAALRPWPSQLRSLLLDELAEHCPKLQRQGSRRCSQHPPQTCLGSEPAVPPSLSQSPAESPADPAACSAPRCCASPCSLHPAFLESLFPNLAFKQEQQGGRQAKAAGENISSSGPLPTYLAVTPTHRHIFSHGLGTRRLPGTRAAWHRSSVFPAAPAQRAASAGTGCAALPGLAHRCALLHKSSQPSKQTQWKRGMGQKRTAMATEATLHLDSNEVWESCIILGCTQRLCCHICTGSATGAGLRLRGQQATLHKHLAQHVTLNHWGKKLPQHGKPPSDPSWHPASPTSKCSGVDRSSAHQ